MSHLQREDRYPRIVGATDLARPDKPPDHPQSPACAVYVALDDVWRAVVHVTEQNGALVVRELEVVPRRVEREHDPQWSPAPVELPPGGLTTRLLRQIPLTLAAEYAREFLSRAADTARELHGRGVLRLHALEGDDATHYAGFTLETLEAPRRLGRRRRPDSYYAEIAAVYVGALQRGSRSPVADTAAALTEQSGAPHSQTEIRDALTQARARDLLTKTRRGVASGELTDKAKAILAQAEEGER